MIAKLTTLILIIFSLAGFSIPSAGLLHTTPVFAQTLEDDDGDAEAELEEQDVNNEATTTEDSSADENILENDNDFGDDGAIIDQDNEADQDALNVGVQEQDLTQELDQEQDAANINVDRDVQIGIQRPTPPPPPEEEPPTTPPVPPGPPPEERGIFCFSGEIPTRFTFCFATQSECEEFRQSGTFMGSDVVPLTECERVDEIPENCEPIGAGRLPCAEQTGPSRD